ncbi:MAG: hypothetical protein LBE12_00840 [Planctomycetaceae bacterium]|nr:hypothetical protein [Planctomycetaceae bacterium]
MRNDYRFGSNPLATLSTLNFPLSTIILPFQVFWFRLVLLPTPLGRARIQTPLAGLI